MAEASKWREPSKESAHRKFWEHIKAGGRVLRKVYNSGAVQAKLAITNCTGCCRVLPHR